MSSIQDEIDETMRLAQEQRALESGTRLEEAQAKQEEDLFARAREAQEQEVAQLPEKYRNKTAAEVYQLLQKEKEYETRKAAEGKDAEEGQEEASEDAAEESPEEEDSEAVSVLQEASEEFYKNEGKLDEATVAKLEALPSADLIRAWQKLQSQQPAAPPLSDSDAQEIVASIGGQDSYNKALAWAADNLSQDDRTAYDQVITSGNKAATRFAAEALLARYKAAVGFDGETVSGGRVKSSGVKPYRSEAELRRDLSNPRYQQDPAFRLDVEDRLANSGELL